MCRQAERVTITVRDRGTGIMLENLSACSIRIFMHTKKDGSWHRSRNLAQYREATVAQPAGTRHKVDIQLPLHSTAQMEPFSSSSTHGNQDLQRAGAGDCGK